MKSRKISRREAMAQTGLFVGAAALSQRAAAATALAGPGAPEARRRIRYSLNMATIRGQKLGIVKEIEVAAQAGYDGIEPWMVTIEEYVSGGGKLPDLRKRISDSGLRVESAIAFAEWIVDDDARRAKGMEQAKRDMDVVAQIGGKRIAAPPKGATELPKLEMTAAAERYRALLEAGEQMEVVPQLELWGFSRNLNRLGECVCVAMETGHRNACVLADVYHLYKGGSEFHGIQLLGANTIQVLHMNDYPKDPPREKVDDSYRVYPGDGVAPLADLLRILLATGGQKVLSLELFNRRYWSEDALAVSKSGLAKMKAVVEGAGS
jgi:sugar phosphate isomerase/epimerase